MEIDGTDGYDGHIYRLTKIYEIQELLISMRDKRNELSTKYNRGVNIIGVIDNCLGVTAIALGITGVSLLSKIVAALAVIGIEAVSLRVVGNRAIKKMSLKIDKHEKIAMLCVSSLNTISSLISKSLSDDSISDEEYSLILLEFETFIRMKEDLRIKSKTSLEKMSYLIEIRQLFQLELMFETMFKTVFKTKFKTMFKSTFITTFETGSKTMFETMFEKLK